MNCVQRDRACEAGFGSGRVILIRKRKATVIPRIVQRRIDAEYLFEAEIGKVILFFFHQGNGLRKEDADLGRRDPASEQRWHEQEESRGQTEEDSRMYLPWGCHVVTNGRYGFARLSSTDRRDER
jgi:hypothetical protein